ncbi:uncharacterized protein [Embiotoca jacksoni]|uniref:uncharacterized protein n=1 Tax=Embiotoca jacksoni TaxID=100190 RepID=UPI0037038D2B
MDTDRTVVVSGVPDVLPPGRMIDKLTVHFQSSRRSNGGDVEVVEYPTDVDGVALVAFDRAEDAARAAAKERQVMTDDTFPEDYLLTVFPFSRDVFPYVSSATVDLSAFGGDQASLIESLRSAHGSLRFRPLTPQRKALVEGPFAAVRGLGEDLVSRAGRAGRAGETPLHPKVAPRRASVGAGEARGVSRTGSRSASSRRKGHGESLAPGSFWSTESNEEEEEEEEEEVRTEHGVGRRKADRREVVGEETSASSSSGRTTERREEVISQKHGSTGTGGENRSGSFHSGTDEAGRKDLPAPSRGDPDLRPRPRPSQELWLDSHVFRYVEKLHKEELDRCLRGVDASAERVEGADLTRITLTEKQTSGTASRVPAALEDLRMLAEHRSWKLRAHEIVYDEAAPPGKRGLTRICDDVNSLFEDVVYAFEDGRIKIIGPWVSSLLFCKRVEDRMAKLKDTPYALNKLV